MFFERLKKSDNHTFQVLLPDLIGVEQDGTIRIKSPHAKIEIGPRDRPYANIDLSSDWLLIEHGSYGYSRLQRALHADAHVLALTDQGYQSVLPRIQKSSIEEILLVDILTDWDTHHKAQITRTPDMSLLAREALRILKPGGYITIVEVSDPAPYAKVEKIFMDAGFSQGKRSERVKQYSQFSHPQQYQVRFKKP